MAHYYLNVRNGTGLICDPEGEDFSGLPAARERAVESVRSILCDEIRSSGLINLQGHIEIADQLGSVVLRLPFREAVDLKLDEQPEGA